MLFGDHFDSFEFPVAFDRFPMGFLVYGSPSLTVNIRTLSDLSTAINTRPWVPMGMGVRSPAPAGAESRRYLGLVANDAVFVSNLRNPLARLHHL